VREADLAESWMISFDLLPKVSRTFALAIAGLRDPLRGCVAVSYLLCRILDTIEDAPGITARQRWEAMEPFLRCLPEACALPDGWSERIAGLLGPRSAPSDLELLEKSDAVLACFAACDPSSRLAMTRWVTEMGKGMVAWSERMGEGEGVLKTLPSLVALDRYCYYIAGTVGHLLTDLFYIHSPSISKVLFYELQEDAEAFGLGLQKVNIVKDIRDDLRRGWCFIPLDGLREQGLEPRQLVEEESGDAAYRAVLPVLAAAAEHLERAFRYLSRMPVEEQEIRLFLAMSLFFAVKTLALVAEEPTALMREEKLKISRGEVASVLALCRMKINRPKALEAYYREIAKPLGVFAARRGEGR
jgi:farnesyl-diphosphate farnesyltransferase